MASSLQTVTVFVVALLPGAFFVWSFERNAGRYGIGLRDRAFRLVGTSAAFIALAAYPLYWLYSNYWTAFASREPLPLWLLVVPIAYVAVPSSLGWLVGVGLHNGAQWAQSLAGLKRAPRAWDHLFQGSDAGWVRCKMKSGAWIGGIYAEIDKQKPYASGYPESQEIYLTRSVGVDPVYGSFRLGGDDQPHQGDGGLLMRWEEIEYLEFIPLRQMSSEDEEGEKSSGDTKEYP